MATGNSMAVIEIHYHIQLGLDMRSLTFNGLKNSWDFRLVLLTQQNVNTGTPIENLEISIIITKYKAAYNGGS